MLAQQASSGWPLVGLGQLGISGVVALAALRLWWVERQERIDTQARLLDVTERAITATTEAAAAQRAGADAVDRLTDEIRRGTR